jgi:hypothetical protein
VIESAAHGKLEEQAIGKGERQWRCAAKARIISGGGIDPERGEVGKMFRATRGDQEQGETAALYGEPLSLFRLASPVADPVQIIAEKAIIKPFASFWKTLLEAQSGFDAQPIRILACSREFIRAAYDIGASVFLFHPGSGQIDLSAMTTASPCRCFIKKKESSAL